MIRIGFIVKVANNDQLYQWNAFVDRHHGSFFHYREWEKIYNDRKRSFIPLCALDESEKLVAIFPLVQEKRLFSSALFSLPDGASGGIIFKKGLSAKEKREVTHLFFEFINENFCGDCAKIVVKDNIDVDGKGVGELGELLAGVGFVRRENSSEGLPCTFVLKLSSSFDKDIWHGVWNRKMRSNVNRAKHKGIVVTESLQNGDVDEVVSLLYRMYDRFSSLPLSRGEIRRRIQVFDAKSKLFYLYINNQLIGVLLCYYTPDMLYLSKVGFTDKMYDMDGARLLFSEAIKDACNQGYKFAELGVTDKKGSMYFKSHFKGKKIPIVSYEKVCSEMRLKLWNISLILELLWVKRRYLWKQKKEIMKKMMKRQLEIKG